MLHKVLAQDEIMELGRKHPSFAMLEEEHGGITGSLARLALTVMRDSLTDEAALEAGLNYLGSTGYAIVTVNHTPGGATYIFTKQT